MILLVLFQQHYDPDTTVPLISIYISVPGQKGIGFKSVFRVTDCPEVHSNGFHIKFDVNSGPMGYILPHWMEQDTTKTKDK